ncbi:MAG: ATP-binding cassette domain-containing protein [Litorilituus sp.]|nr:ATP-binding cassette domain-containing protein [Litorilituus sp.]
MIKLNNINLIFKQRPVLTSFNLTLKAGEKIALLGPSGVGKSSILKLLCGIYHPTAGTVLNQAQRIGYIFQEARLLPWLTVEQNIAQVLIPLKLEQAEITDRIDAILKDVELSGFSQHYPHQISGGMAQRVSLARAFIIEPDLLLLDEPLSALDPALKKQLSRFIQHYVTKYNPTLIYVSHHPEDALPIVDQCLLLSKNKPHQQFCLHQTSGIEHIIEQFYHSEEQ